MKKINFAEMDVELLQKQKKTITSLTGLLIGMLIILLIVGVYISFNKGFSIFIIIPFTLFPIVAINLNNLKEINKELKSRKNID